VQQEISKPVAITLIVVVIAVIGGVVWYLLGRQQTYPGYQAPAGMAGSGMPGGPGGMMPGGAPGAPGMAPGQAPGGAPGYPPGGAPR
jgi:hypothetical protein